MKHTFLFIVRHGETIWNVQRKMMGKTDIPLSHRGKVQARAIAKLLAGYPIDVIYSSPLTRTLQTAKAIRTNKTTPLILHAALKERDFGVLEGKTYEEAHAYGTPMQYGESKYYPYFRPPDGERLLDVENRTKLCIQDLTHHRGKNIVIVSHGSFLRVLFCHLLGLKLDEMGDVHFDNASLSIIEIEENQPGRLHALNITHHLPNEL